MGNRNAMAIAKLAKFIMEHIEGEPSEDGGAIDCAIRLLHDHPKYHA